MVLQALIPAPERQQQADLHELENSLVNIENTRPVRATQWNPG